jgi:predicted RNA-binding protein with PUA-like domain
MRHWLLKTEPGTFSIDDLARQPRKTTGWDGVRNYQARNFLRDDMRRGDLAFLYHSSCAVPAIVGIVEIAGEARPDQTAFDPHDLHYDPDSDRAEPRWFLVNVRLKRKFARAVTLEELKAHARGKLKDMVILKRGNRLSVTPVTDTEWRFVLDLTGERVIDRGRSS